MVGHHTHVDGDCHHDGILIGERDELWAESLMGMLKAVLSQAGCTLNGTPNQVNVLAVSRD